jgi:hypothetical protein
MLTWEQFKKWVESKGVTDEMLIKYIDINGRVEWLTVVTDGEFFYIEN